MADTLGRRRGRLDIIGDILSLCQKPTQKTHIMYKCNMSFEQAGRYLDFLSSKNLVRPFYEAGKELYVVSEKGMSFIQMHQSLIDLLS